MAPNGKHFVIVYPARPFTPSSFLFCTPLETNQIASPFCLQTYEDAINTGKKKGPITGINFAWEYFHLSGHQNKKVFSINIKRLFPKDSVKLIFTKKLRWFFKNLDS